MATDLVFSVDRLRDVDDDIYRGWSYEPIVLASGRNVDESDMYSPTEGSTMPRMSMRKNARVAYKYQ